MQTTDDNKETQTVRLIRLFIWLLTDPSSFTVRRVCRDCGIGKRTLFRDLSRLSAAGINIAFDHMAQHYRIDWLGSDCNTLGQCRLTFTCEECIALLAILHRVNCPNGSDLQQYRITLFQKLASWAKEEWGQGATAMRLSAKVIAEHPATAIGTQTGTLALAVGQD